MKITPVFIWYDLWIGVYINRAKRRIYVMVFPTLGFQIDY